MKRITFFSFILFSVLSVTFTSCKKDEELPDPKLPTETLGKFRIELDHVFGASNFALGTSFTNGSSEQLTFTTFKYYVSNVVLTKADGSTWKDKNSYYLVDVSNLASTLLTIDSVPTAEYNSFSFNLGVDSTRNVSGAQTGALDPANSMFWTWSTGYIFTKMEGTSPQITDMGNSFMLHLGGYKESNNTNAIQAFSHTFSGEIMTIKPTATPQIHLMVDLQRVFDGPNTFSVASMPMIMSPGTQAVRLMQNFASGFEYDHLHN